MISCTGTFTNKIDYSCRKLCTISGIVLAVSLIALGILLNPHVLSLGIGSSPSTFTIMGGGVLGLLSVALYCLNRKEPLKPIHITNQASCNGDVDIEKAKLKLEEIQKYRLEKITFNPEQLLKELTGGTCTALALKFIEDFLRQDVSRGTVESRVATSALGVKTSNQTLRTIQAAMNTIEIRPDFRGEPCHQEKAEALLAFNDLKLVTVFQGIDWDSEDKEVLTERIAQLPKGIFFIRAILPKSNEKGEEWGHSLALIILDSETFYFYEPNDGVYEINGSTDQKSQQLTHMLKKAHEEWTIPHLTFYQVALSSEGVTENS